MEEMVCVPLDGNSIHRHSNEFAFVGVYVKVTVAPVRVGVPLFVLTNAVDMFYPVNAEEIVLSCD